MSLDLYSRSEKVDVCFSTFNSNILTFKSEIKNLTFDVSIIKLVGISDSIEKAIERESFSSLSLDSKPVITTTLTGSTSSLERFELHLTLFDEHLSSKYFYFDLQKNWTGGGRFFIRDLEKE